MTGLPQDLVLLAFAILLPLVLIAARVLLGRVARRPTCAEERAEGLLRELLSEEERRNLDQFGSLIVSSPGIPGRTYCIPAHPGLVTVYESGKKVMWLCLQPVETLPAANFVLLLKLMIEANETEYLRTANVQQLR